MAPPDDLASLVQEAAAGDQDAFAALYDATASRAYGLAISILGDPEQAAEICRHAYLHLWTHSARFDPAQQSAISWILAVVHRQAVDRARAVVPGPEPAGPSLLADASLLPVSEPGSRSLADRVRTVLNGLPVAQRRALRLAYLQGRSSADVAALTDSTQRRAQAQIRRGLLELRDRLGDDASSSSVRLRSVVTPPTG
jgi:RNA polymerase sigma-70 factor (ECF subfamily)